MEKMKRRYRRLTAAALACMLLCSGCSGEKEEPEVYIDKNEPDVVITLFTQGENISEIINKCCSDVINPKTKGNIILYSDFADFYAEEGLSYRELLLKRMESGQADDLYIIPAEDVLEFDQKGFIYDLSGLDCISSLSEDALRQSTYKGKVFSVPLSYTGFGLIWNVDMLHQYQLEIPETLDEFWNVCDVLKQNGILPYGANKDFGLSVPAMCAGLGPLYQNPESEALTAALAKGETPVSTYMRDGFAFLQTMIDREYLDVERSLETLPGSDEEAAFFAEGKCAFISSLCRAAAFARDYPFAAVMTALPVLKEGPVCVVGADQRLAVNPNTEHLGEALAILENLCTTDTLNAFAGELGKVSSARGNEATTLPQAEKFVSCLASGGQIPNQDFTLPFNTWNTIKELCVKLCEGADVETVCREYDERQKEEIALYGDKDI